MLKSNLRYIRFSTDATVSSTDSHFKDEKKPHHHHPLRQVQPGSALISENSRRFPISRLSYRVSCGERKQSCLFFLEWVFQCGDFLLTIWLKEIFFRFLWSARLSDWIHDGKSWRQTVVLCSLWQVFCRQGQNFEAHRSKPHYGPSWQQVWSMWYSFQNPRCSKAT